MEILAAVGSSLSSLVLTELAFFAVLGIVVFVHEFGHFIVGRLCGIGVTAFSIGFGPELVGWTDRHGTRWKLSAIPLGGYVKFVGDMNGASMPDPQTLSDMSAAERAVSFHHQRLAKRAATVAAGPIANFLLAIAIFAGSAYVNGRTIMIPRIEEVNPGSAAERAGFEPGDLVVAINGHAIASFSDMQRIVSASAGETLAVVVDRRDRQVTLTAVPDLKEQDTPFGKQRIGLLGLKGSQDKADVRTLQYGLVGALGVGAVEAWRPVQMTFDFLGKLVTGRESPEQLSGPIRIAKVSGQIASLGSIEMFLSWIGLISVSIGLLNLFPIPLLDGGHLLFYAIEGARGAPLSERAQEIGFRIGLAIVVMLMLFATYNDIFYFRT